MMVRFLKLIKVICQLLLAGGSNAHGVFFKVYVVKVSINYRIVETKEHIKTKGTTPQALLAYI